MRCKQQALLSVAPITATEGCISSRVGSRDADAFYKSGSHKTIRNGCEFLCAGLKFTRSRANAFDLHSQVYSHRKNMINYRRALLSERKEQSP